MARRLSRLATAFAKTDRGTTAIEFGFVAFPLIGTVAMAMSLGLALFFSASLQGATRKAARLILVGSVQSSTTTASQFMANTFCPLLPTGMTCASVVINVKVERTAAQMATTTGWYDVSNSNQTALLTTAYTSGTTTFCTGQPGDYVYMQVFYPLSPVLAFLAPASSVATVNGKPAFLLMATAAFRNQQFSANTGGC